eukprot:PhM_4_TR3091/c2_g1_i2/m.106876
MPSVCCCCGKMDWMETTSLSLDECDLFLGDGGALLVHGQRYSLYDVGLQSDNMLPFCTYCAAKVRKREVPRMCYVKDGVPPFPCDLPKLDFCEHMVIARVLDCLSTSLRIAERGMNKLHGHVITFPHDVICWRELS